MFSYKTESQLQQFLIDNFNLYFDFEYNSSEFIVKGGRIDIIGKSSNAIYAIEVKRDFITPSAIKQVSKYVDCLKVQYPNADVYGIATAPKLDPKIDVNDLPSGISVRLIDNVNYIEPTSQATKKRVTYTLDEELIERLREYSDKTMIPQAKIVNEALIEYLNKNEPTKQ